jgi:periplasmic divalent cation tolerance protein
VGSREEASSIARSLVEARLAACVNVLPGITSIYRWEGAVEESPECLLIVKSTRERYPELEAAIRSLHSYDIPEIVALPLVAGLEPYLAWLTESVEGQPGR